LKYLIRRENQICNLHVQLLSQGNRKFISLKETHKKSKEKKMREAYPKKVYCKGAHTEIVFFLLKENNDLHINLQKCACIHRTIRFEMPVMESQKPNLHPFPKSFRMNLTHIV